MTGNEEAITIKVRKGVKVNIVEEGGVLRDNDPRMREDRDIHIVLPERLKVGVKRLSDAPAARPNVVTMCG